MRIVKRALFSVDKIQLLRSVNSGKTASTRQLFLASANRSDLRQTGDMNKQSKRMICVSIVSSATDTSCKLSMFLFPLMIFSHSVVMMQDYVAVFSLLVLISTSFAHRNCSCSTVAIEPPKPLDTANGTCYIYVDQPSTWSAAKASCASQGGHLITGLASGSSDVLHQWLPEGVYWTVGTFNILWKWDDGPALNVEDFSQGNQLSEASGSAVMPLKGFLTVCSIY